jgi:RNA polymerase sigma-70 factor, ECF subfamily
MKTLQNNSKKDNLIKKSLKRNSSKKVSIRYNRSEILKRAWFIYRFKNENNLSWNEVCKKSWSIAKANKDSLNFNDLYKRYNKDLLSFILFKTHQDYDLSQDVLSLTFTKAYNNLFSFDSTKSNIRTWLYNIAKNLIVDHYKSKLVKEKAINISSYVDQNGKEYLNEKISNDNNYSNNDIENHFERETLSNDINKAIDSIENPLYKAIIESLLHENLSYIELSDKYNVPIGTVKNIINRSRKQLQDKLSDYKQNFISKVNSLKDCNKELFYEVENEGQYY